jgi:hypothetical protein
MVSVCSNSMLWWRTRKQVELCVVTWCPAGSEKRRWAISWMWGHHFVFLHSQRESQRATHSAPSHVGHGLCADCWGNGNTVGRVCIFKPPRHEYSKKKLKNGTAVEDAEEDSRLCGWKRPWVSQWMGSACGSLGNYFHYCQLYQHHTLRLCIYKKDSSFFSNKFSLL